MKQENDFNPYTLSALRALEPGSTAAKEFATSLAELLLKTLRQQPIDQTIQQAVRALNQLGHSLKSLPVHGEGYSYEELFEGGTRCLRIIGMVDWVHVTYHSIETEQQKLVHLSPIEREHYLLRQEFQRKAETLWAREYLELSSSERLIAALDTLIREVNNGGFQQYFENTEGLQTDHVIQFLGQIGAMDSQKLVIAAKKASAKGHSQNLHEFDKRFYKANNDIELLAMNYINKSKPPA